MRNNIENLWNPALIAASITQGAIHATLDDGLRSELMATDAIPERVVCALTDPKPLDICMPVLNAVLAAQYHEVFEALALPRASSIYEPCVGASPPVLFAAEAYTQGRGSYLTINLNRKLRAELQEKIAHIKSSVRIMEDNAVAATLSLPDNSFDVACFHHAINDILQTACAEPRGMDTTAIDWFPNERQMIEWLAEDYQRDQLKPRGKPELMAIVSEAARLVKPGGYLIFDHFNWCRFIGVDWFPWDLFYNLIPMTRGWIRESGLPLQEVKLPGLPAQWWMIWQVKD
ncbi:MAG: methyltransferase domain-containing protein [Candidatus Hydrogenedentes bacterium]|nr:methyltransferase domain-containing protein [Candidatus Hydrogenedentota bacterium]